MYNSRNVHGEKGDLRMRNAQRTRVRPLEYQTGQRSSKKVGKVQ